MGKTYNTRDLAKAMARQSMLNEGEVYNMLMNMPFVLKQILSMGYSVKLDGLCTLRLACTARGNGVDTEEEVSSKQIKGLKVIFTPEGTREANQTLTRSLLTGMDYMRYEPAKKAEKDDEGGNGGGTNPDDEFIDPTA